MSEPPITVFTILCSDFVESAVISDSLWSAGVQGVEEVDHGDGRVSLRSSFGVGRSETHARLRDLLATHPRATWSVDDLDSVATDTWKRYAQPVRITDDLWVAPMWHPERTDIEGRTVVCIDPGSTFGLGDHPTTRGSLDLLVRIMRSDPAASSSRILDVGCGSGVLGITGLVLGAALALGVDINPASVPVSYANARANAVDSKWSVTLDDLSTIAPEFDLITANILAPVLIELANDIKRLLRPGGSLIISGVLVDRNAHVLQAFEPLEVVEELDVDGWATFVLRERPAS